MVTSFNQFWSPFLILRLLTERPRGVTLLIKKTNTKKSYFTPDALPFHIGLKNGINTKISRL